MPDGRPNILLVIADELTPILTGTYGHPAVETPNLDRLAARGVRFDETYTQSPVCGPARDCLVTGNYVSTIGAWDNAASLSDEQPTFAHSLTLAGYDVALSGEIHFVGADQLHGFDRRFTPTLYSPDFSATPAGAERDEIDRYRAGGVTIGEWNDYHSNDTEVHFRALEYLRSKGRDGSDARPFHLTVSYHHPHPPFWPPTSDWERYEDREADFEPGIGPRDVGTVESTMDDWIDDYHGLDDRTTWTSSDIRHVRRAYAALVSGIDRRLGELLEVLEATNLEGETVVVFCSDHGDMLYERGMVGKRTFYDPACRVPLVIRFPDGRHAGTVYEGPTGLVDLVPTFFDLAGVDEGDRGPVDGRSLLEGLGSDGATDRLVFSEYHAAGVDAPCFMARRGRYKYIYIHGHDEHLFDLETDPHESVDLADDPDHTAEVASLRTALLAQFDPDRVEAAVTASRERRHVVRRAMVETGTSWHHTPRFDATVPALERYHPK